MWDIKFDKGVIDDLLACRCIIIIMSVSRIKRLSVIIFEPCRILVFHYSLLIMYCLYYIIVTSCSSLLVGAPSSKRRRCREVAQERDRRLAPDRLSHSLTRNVRDCYGAPMGSVHVMSGT